MLKFFRRLILSLVLIIFLLFAGVTFAGYYYLDAIAARLIGPKVTAVPVKKAKPVVATDEEVQPDSLEADLGRMAEEDEATAQANAVPRESQVDLLDYYDFILETRSHTEQAPLCEIICERARFNAGRDDLALQNIKNYFDHEKDKEKAFQDPAFRIALINLSLTTDLFPKPIREIILDIEKVEAMTSMEKLMFVFRAEIDIAKFVVYVKSHQKENLHLRKQLEELQKLQRQCSPKNKGATLELCAALTQPNW